MLSIKNLEIKVEGKTVISDFSIEVEAGEVVALTGPNGSGKSSIAMTLMGSAQYIVDSGEIIFDGVDLLKLSMDERARIGLFVSWQNPISIPGVSIFSFCKALQKTTTSLTDFKKYLEELAEKVGLPKEYVLRNVNEGFSGGERKRLELFQLLLLKPKLAILDEIDSGMDTDGIKILGKIIKEMKNSGTSFVIITHNNQLIKELEIERVWKTTN